MGYSRDLRPDRPQVTVDLSMDRATGMPIGLAVNPGNIMDVTHFDETFRQQRTQLDTWTFINTYDFIGAQMKILPSKEMKRLFSLVLIAASATLTMGLLIAHASPAQSYEPSIYSGTPLFVWLCLLFCLVVSIIVISFKIHSNPYEKGVVFFFVLIAFLSYVAIMGLPIIRDYYIWNGGGDGGTHLKYIMSIISTGSSGQIHYPLAHILTVEIMQVLELGTLSAFSYVPFILTVITPLFYYVASIALFKDKKVAILVTFIYLLMVTGQHPYFSPNFFGNMMFPLVIYCITKLVEDFSIRNVILVTTTVPTLILYHPVSFLIIFTYLFIFLLLNRGAFFFKAKNLLLLTLFLTAFIAWISHTSLLQGMFQSVLKTSSGDRSSYGEILMGIVHFAQSNGISAELYIFLEFGVLLFMLGLVAIYLLAEHRRKGIDEATSSLALMTVPLSLLFAVAFFFNIGITPLRFIPHLIIFILFIVGLFIYKIPSLPGIDRRKGVITTIFVLGVLLMVSFVSVYPSEYSYELSYQNTRTEISGYDWTLYYGDSNHDTSSYNVIQWRLAEFLLFGENVDAQGTVTNTLPPYYIDSFIGAAVVQHYANDTYLIVTKKDEVVYREINPQAYETILTDFNQLNYNLGVNRVYSNSQFDCWEILTSTRRTSTFEYV